MRFALARWLQVLVLRLDPYDPLKGARNVAMDRGLNERWLVTVVFFERNQARDFTSHIANRIRHECPEPESH